MKKIRNMSLSGGGNFGFAHIGALFELEKYADHIDIEHITAVSCGSIIAALYAVGYSAEELREIFFALDLDALICDSSWWKRFYSKFGMYNANKFEEEIDRLIAVKTNIKNCTFCQIDTNLTIVATNLNYQKPVCFNRELTPEMVISKSIRMSIAYPFLITPVLYAGDYFSDGGEFINYPISLFDDLEETVGIAFVAHNENSDGTLKNRTDIGSIYDYIVSVATTMSRATYVSQMTPEYMDRTILVNIPENITSTQFKLSLEQKTAIYEAGRIAVVEQIGKILPIELAQPITTNTCNK